MAPHPVFRREWAMPSADTFDIPPIAALVKRALITSSVSIDPFARNKLWATHTNDLNPKTNAEHHLDAVEFLRLLEGRGVKADLLIFDPPYAPRQIAECYQEAGKKVGMRDTQSARLYSECRDAAMPVLSENAIVISCGWNSVGMGKGRGFELVEILMVCHGGAHNDTIIVVEQRNAETQPSFQWGQ